MGDFINIDYNTFFGLRGLAINRWFNAPSPMSAPSPLRDLDFIAVCGCDGDLMKFWVFGGKLVRLMGMG
jgi:hypothetical protein